MTPFQRPSNNQIPQSQQPLSQDQFAQHRSEQFQYPKPTSGMAVAGLVLGILALLTSFIPIINNGAFFLGLLGLIFSIVGLVGTMRGKKSGKGIAIAALVLTILSCVIVLATQSMFSAAIDEASTPAISSESTSAPSSADTSSDTTSTTGQSSDSYTITDEALNSDSYTAVIAGTFTNNTDSDLSYVQVSYNLYDADGAVIGNAYANANNIKAGGTWKYEAYCSASPDDIVSFERGDVTAW